MVKGASTKIAFRPCGAGLVGTMALKIVAKAIETEEPIDLGDGGPIIGHPGEVLLTISDTGNPETSYKFVMTADDARLMGKGLIQEGWQALTLLHGPVKALQIGLGKGRKA